MRSAAFYLCIGLGCALLSGGLLLAALVVAVAVGERDWAAVPGELLTSAPLILLFLASGAVSIWLARRIGPAGPP